MEGSMPLSTQVLRDDVACPSLSSSIESYRSELETCGFKIIKIDDMSEDWAAYTAARVKEMQDDKDSLSAGMLCYAMLWPDRRALGMMISA